MFVVGIPVLVLTVVGVAIWFGLLAWATREDGLEDRLARGRLSRTRRR